MHFVPKAPKVALSVTLQQGKSDFAVEKSKKYPPRKIPRRIFLYYHFLPKDVAPKMEAMNLGISVLSTAASLNISVP